MAGVETAPSRGRTVAKSGQPWGPAGSKASVPSFSISY